MSTYVHDNKSVNVFSNGDLKISNKLKKTFYNIVSDPKDNLYLDEIDPPKLPVDLYGGINERAKMVLHTFSKKKDPMGALFIGDKGNGKTLIMNYIALKSDLPVICLNTAFNLNLVIDLLLKITDDYVLYIDEFDKKYPISDINADVSKDRENGNGFYRFLSYLNGENKGNKYLTIISANSINYIDQNLINRPGRIYYRFNYSGVDRDEVRNILYKNLNNKDNFENILEGIYSLGSVSYDTLNSIIEEANRYNQKFDDIIEFLNVGSNYQYINFNRTFTLYRNNVKVEITSVEFSNYSVDKLSYPLIKLIKSQDDKVAIYFRIDKKSSNSKKTNRNPIDDDYYVNFNCMNSKSKVPTLKEISNEEIELSFSYDGNDYIFNIKENSTISKTSNYQLGQSKFKYNPYK